MTFEIETVVKLVIYGGGIVGIWYTLKNKVEILDSCMKNLEDKHNIDKKLVDKKIEEIDQDVKDLSKDLSSKMDWIRDKLELDHREIMKAIHESGR